MLDLKWTNYGIGPAAYVDDPTVHPLENDRRRREEEPCIEEIWKPIETAYGQALDVKARGQLDWIVVWARWRCEQRQSPPAAEVNKRLEQASKGALAILQAFDYRRDAGQTTPQDLLESGPVIRHIVTGDGAGSAAFMHLRDAVDRGAVNRWDLRALHQHLNDEDSQEWRLDDLLILIWSLARVANEVSANGKNGRPASPDYATAHALVTFHRSIVGDPDSTGWTHDPISGALSGPVARLAHALFAIRPEAFAAPTEKSLDRAIRDYKKGSPQTGSEKS